MRNLHDKRKVFLFLDSLPEQNGSGAALRFFSNIRAYLDIGCEVEVIQVAAGKDGTEPCSDLDPVKWTRVIEKPPSGSFLGRAAFRLGLPTRDAVQYAYPINSIVLREARKRFHAHPEAVFHFDGESQANVIPFLPRNLRSIWSMHDPPSLTSSSVTKIACESETRDATTSELREFRFLGRLERLMAKCSSLVLCIGNRDAQRLKNEWGCDHAEYFPMSIPDEANYRSGRQWTKGGRLCLLHLGSISHLPSFRSLEFIFERVFPLMPPALLDRVSLEVVGRNADNERTRRIMALAEPYRNASFHGFVEDIMPYYEKGDAQIVASTDALGLRTRIIESFAFGLPVLSTSIASEGIGGLTPGKDLLIADDAGQFVDSLAQLLTSPALLAELSAAGRAFYVNHQSRRVVANTLSECLEKFFPNPAVAQGAHG